MLDTPANVEHALARFADAFQPRTGSILTPGAHGNPHRFPFRTALLDDLEVRAELTARMSWLEQREREVLLGWYVEGRDARTLGRTLRCSARHVHRLRHAAIDRLVELGRSDVYADADLAEFA